MKFKITFYVWGKKFSAVADTIAEAYEYVRAIIDANDVKFPDKPEALSEYMIILVDMRNDQLKYSDSQNIRIDQLDVSAGDNRRKEV